MARKRKARGGAAEQIRTVANQLSAGSAAPMAGLNLKSRVGKQGKKRPAAKRRTIVVTK
jgi:hypothetical protein